MIYLHKILPTLVLPIGIVLLLLLCAAVINKRALTLAAVLVLFFLSIPLTSNYFYRAAEQFQTRRLVAEVGAADAVVVLSGTLTSAPLAGGGSISEWGDPDRFFAGVELVKANKAPVLIFTGGTYPWMTNSPPEGVILKEYALQLGVPADHIIVTANVENTEDEAREVRKYVGNAKKVILVTSAFHMSRAQALFVAFGMEVIPFPVDFGVDATRSFTVLDMLPNASSLLKSEMAMREWLGQAFYSLKMALVSPH
ncbi:MAG TPA: YdcF family protein [Nitrospira sp.]|jgi:uncharacterized SAM-binding protein YcdF (DUF218 family)|nr:YdcF family protein [Nitrospira sp.]